MVCLQEHENRKKKNAQWKMIEKQVEQFLTHWRARISERIGIENKQVTEFFYVGLKRSAKKPLPPPKNYQTFV